MESFVVTAPKGMILCLMMHDCVSTFLADVSIYIDGSLVYTRCNVNTTLNIIKY